MKKNQFLILLMAPILSGISSTSHSAEERRFFFGLSGGYQRYSDYASVTLQDPDMPTFLALQIRKHFSISPFASLMAGYKLNNNLKIGLSFSYNIGNNKLEFSHDNENAIFKISNSWDISGNLIYYTSPDSAFSPLIGAKLGYNSRAVDIDLSSTTVVNKKNNSGILLGAISGISYKLNDTTRIELTYSIDKLSDALLTSPPNPNNPNSFDIVKMPNLSHKVALGMTFAF